MKCYIIIHTRSTLTSGSENTHKSGTTDNAYQQPKHINTTCPDWFLEGCQKCAHRRDMERRIFRLLLKFSPVWTSCKKKKQKSRHIVLAMTFKSDYKWSVRIKACTVVFVETFKSNYKSFIPFSQHTLLMSQKLCVYCLDAKPSKPIITWFTEIFIWFWWTLLSIQF